jgi:N6-L-threonylcarbamoyladenine synthase
MEGHLLSPLLAIPSPRFRSSPARVGGHSQLFEVEGVGRYRLLGDTKDDAPARRSTRRRSFWASPIRADRRSPARGAGRDGAVSLPRPMLAAAIST